MSCEIRSMITAYFFGSSIRMPPIFTNSAVTPSAFVELTFSTNAGGNVFSIPKRIPIFLSAISQILFPTLLAVIVVDVQPMRNPLAMEKPRHLHIRVQAHIPIRRSQHNLHLPVPAQ